MRKSLLSGLAALLLMAGVTAGCGKRTPADANQAAVSAAPTLTPAADTAAPATPAPAPTPAPAQSAVIKAYFGNTSGDALVEKSATITYNTEPDKYKAALLAMTHSDDAQTAIPFVPSLKIKSVSATNGALTIDLTFANTDQLGAPGEALFLNALKKTLFQFPEVKSFNILVGGQAVDSLMGHMELPHPIEHS